MEALLQEVKCVTELDGFNLLWHNIAYGKFKFLPDPYSRP
jgi:hypothetical protein